LRRVGFLTNNVVMVKRSEKMIGFIKEQSIRNPLSNGYWAKVMIEHFQGTNEILVLGKSAQTAGFNLLRKFIPNKVMMASELPDATYPLMKGKYPKEVLCYYLCKDYACTTPFYEEKDLIEQLF